MTTRETNPNPEGVGVRDGPTWVVVLVTLGVWLAFLLVEVSLLPQAFRAASDRGEAVGGFRGHLFGVSHWWSDYWWLFAVPMFLLLAGPAVVRSLSADQAFRRRPSRNWLLVFVLPPALLGLVSLAVCYRP